MSSPIITVVGSFLVGLTIRASRMPVMGETLIGSDFDLGPGGKGSNQAVGVARLGGKSYFAGIIGDDQLGKIAIELYRKEGVDMTYLQTTHNASTGVGFIILDDLGDNGIILDIGSNKLMDAFFVNQIENQIQKSDMVMTVLEIPVEASFQALYLGKKHGVRTILNPAPATWLPDEVLSNVDFLTPNETELRIIMGLAPDDPAPTIELARALKSRLAGSLIVTMGDQGALLLGSEGELQQIPAVKVRVIDSTGAGDAFNSGLAVSIAEGRNIVEAVKYANCTGALECTKLSVIPALPTREMASDLYQNNFGP